MAAVVFVSARDEVEGHRLCDFVSLVYQECWAVYLAVFVQVCE